MVELVLGKEEEEVAKTVMSNNNYSNTKKKTKTTTKKKKLNDGFVKWERFLPKMVLRVLLVEADDSTRQIIAALLRKCNYRVVAVSDGLKAWEILKGRPHNVDLILTEVDLPSISGFALLTLIMEHKICKNIPVILMSSQDSISTVYKCMLRGAADYLVKPIRRNELRNMWQHVWRRQSQHIGGNVPQDESVGQQKVEATSENNAASNHSRSSMYCTQRNKGYIGKGSDAQSSCTKPKPDLEAECTQMETMQDCSQPIWGKYSLNDVKMQDHEAYASFGGNLLAHGSAVEGSAVGVCKDGSTWTIKVKDVEPKNQRDASISSDAGDVTVNSSRAAFDFMQAFNNHISSSNICTNNSDSSPVLDLSLRRCHPSGLENQITEERHILRHSDASAFSRYTNRPSQPLHSTLANDCDQQKEFGTNSEKNVSNIVIGCHYDAPGLMLSTLSVPPMATDHSDQSRLATSATQHGVFPVPVPVKGIRYSSLCTGYSSVPPSIFCTQSGSSVTPSVSSTSQQHSSLRVNSIHHNIDYEKLYSQFGQNTGNSSYQSMYMHKHKMDLIEDQRHISPATDQSTSSSFCNGAISRLNNMGYGSTCCSNSNVDQVAAGKTAEESKNEEGCFIPNANSHRSIQREAALTKFRLKRKDRCYEKKVWYQSRKKLAEQRPRVKGQFVRQVPSCGNGFDG
ncbi:Response_reg domain-containing protein/CCT domain-containing protein [Cephalotus follicularis]|uniref:Response_reg domain-containing protein/CCT domain-containing protein n=1 Tax=Cephalotus follicularis TaxID=3775 RepID=A0A1Q3BZ26_CEPFO|nr:Response_reg domain-containing protein/CCT domain-containing protein [Cephalotus follicularis]